LGGTRETVGYGSLRRDFAKMIIFEGLTPLESILQDELGAEEWTRTLQTLKCK
jgi:hypothetical protein